MRMPDLPTGVSNNEVEFFRTAPFRAKAMFKCKVFLYTDLPLSIREIIQAKMLANPVAINTLSSILQQNPPAEIAKVHNNDAIEEAFVSCRYGNYDSIPDLVDGQLTPDCPDCGMEDYCQGFGIVCVKPQTPKGEITGRELQVLKLIAKGLMDKEIADKLDLAPTTVLKHVQNIRTKLQVNTRLEIGIWAWKHNLK